MRLLASFEILGVWEMATPEQAQERKDEWNQAKYAFIKNFTHGRKRRRALARAILLKSDEAGAWNDELKQEANMQAIELTEANPTPPSRRGGGCTTRSTSDPRGRGPGGGAQ